MSAVSPPVLADIQKKDILRNKSYAHLDAKRPPKANERLVRDPTWVEKGSWGLPFVHVVIKTKRRTGRKTPPTYKDRHIFYASHMDRYVYQWYAHLTSQAYEGYVADKGFSEAPIAYRSLGGKTNIHFAKEAFDWIKKQSDSFVFISDFSKFFDTLDHRLLKIQIKKVLNVSELSSDHYRVFRSMTMFRYFDLEDIARIKNTSTKLLRHRDKKPDQLLVPEDMRALKKEYLRPNPNRNKSGEVVGIPQGSPISAVYANVYMIDFDYALNALARKMGGFYRRYSDDLIFIAPFHNLDLFQDEFNKQVTTARVTVSGDKTKCFRVINGKPFKPISGIDQATYSDPAIVSYLGFSYNGRCVRLKEGTLNKYYQKLNRRLCLLRYLSTKFGQVVGRKHFYARSSHLGEANRQQLHSKSIRRRNFFSYAYNAENIFDKEDIRHQVAGHWKRINKFIKGLPLNKN